MENASQALLIAAGVLIGILILTLAVYLFSVFGGYATNTQSKLDEDDIAQFNQNFLKYSGLTELTIQDIVTVKNYALESNRKYGNYNPKNDRASENNDYIDVYYADSKAVAHTSSALILNIEDQTLLENEIQKIKAGNKPNRFTCEVIISRATGKVSQIYFYET